MCVKIDNEKCLGCGSCVSFTDQKIFDFNDEGRVCVVAKNIPEDEMDNVKSAIDSCPTSAIYFEEEKEE